MREQEARESSRLLGVEELIFVDGVDGGMARPDVMERIADGRLPFTLVESQKQLWVYRDEWDEWVNERIVQVTAPLAQAA